MNLENIPPIVLKNGTDFFKNLSKEYIKHNNGLFILAPSGAGKTYFCQHQTEPHWIDGDDLWMATGAHPDGPWWTGGIEVINLIDKRSDLVTNEAKLQGFWVIGASNYWLKPDAIVIPEWQTHQQYIKDRHQNNYDGGATPDDHGQVLGHIEVIKKWHSEHGVPQFETIQKAVEVLTQ